MKKKNCPLCNLWKKENEERVYYQDDDIIIVETKDKKGHKCRIMVVSKAHVKNVSYEFFEKSMLKLIEIGKKAFSYFPKFVIMEGTFQTIKSHWHIVSTDLDPLADDFPQIMKTEWIDAISSDYKCD